MNRFKTCLFGVIAIIIISIISVCNHDKARREAEKNNLSIYGITDELGDTETKTNIAIETEFPKVNYYKK